MNSDKPTGNFINTLMNFGTFLKRTLRLDTLHANRFVYFVGEIDPLRFLLSQYLHITLKKFSFPNKT